MSRDRLIHLAENMQTAFFCLFKGMPHDFESYAGDFDIHLQRGNTVSGTGHLEIHVAEVVFVAENITENLVIFAFFDQAHGNTCHWSLERNASIHHCQTAGAD